MEGEPFSKWNKHFPKKKNPAILQLMEPFSNYKKFPWNKSPLFD